MNFDLSFLNSRKCRPVKPMLEFVSSSQRKAIQKLESLYTLSKLDVKAMGISVRTKPLIVAPSGSGKTFAVQRFTKNQGKDILSINSGSWIPWGAKQENYTLTEIRNFVRRHGDCGGVIFLDEIDKCQDHDTVPDGGWERAVFTEFLAVLDGDNRLLSMGWDDQSLRLFRAGGYFVIGAGAWQHLKNEAARPAAGFGASKKQDYRVDLRFGIPDEIAQRFSQDIIAIDYPDELDYAEAIAGIHVALGMPAPSNAIIQYHARKGVESSRGVRYLEAYLTRLLGNNSTLVKRLPVKKTESEEGKFNRLPEDEQRELFKKFHESLLPLAETAEDLALNAELARPQLSRDLTWYFGADEKNSWEDLGLCGAANKLGEHSRKLFINITHTNETEWAEVCDSVRDQLRVTLWSHADELKSCSLFPLAIKLKHECDKACTFRERIMSNRT